MSETETILRGVVLSRVDRKSLTKAVKSLKIDTDTSVDSMVASLADHLVKLHKADPYKLLGCDFCLGASDLSFDKCPYCGLTDVEATAKAAELDAAEAAKPKKVEEKPATNAKPPKKPRAGATEKSGVAAAKPGVAKTKPALTVVHQAEIVSSKQLDDKVAEIEKVQVDVAVSHWQLGRLLKETYDLYQLRTDDSGKRKYKNWGQFVSTELKFTPAYAYDLVGVSDAFSEADIKAVGVTKLRIIARIPDEARKQNLLERAKDEVNGKPALTRNEIEAEARSGGELPNRKALGGGSVGGDEAAKKRAEKAKDRAANKGVSVVIQPGRVTVPLYNAKLSKGKEPVRAFDLSDEPHALEDMLNGIRVKYIISKEQDGLVLTIERTRE